MREISGRNERRYPEKKTEKLELSTEKTAKPSENSWEDFLAKIKSPLLKTTLRQAEGNFAKDKLVITVASDFALEQLKQAKNKQEIEENLHAVAGHEMPLELKKGEIKLKSITPEEIKKQDISNIFG